MQVISILTMMGTGSGINGGSAITREDAEIKAGRSDGHLYTTCYDFKRTLHI